MLEGARRRVARWVGWKAGPPGPVPPMVFSEHEEIRDIARQIGRTKIELDRSILSLRGWGRDLTRRLERSSSGLDGGVDLRTLGETAGGLAHNFNNSLAAILAHTELLMREVPGEGAQRRLRMIREVALEASAAVRRFQEILAREPQPALGPVSLAAVVTEAVEVTSPRWRDEAERAGAVITVIQDVEGVPPVEGNGSELRDALVHLVLNAATAMPRGGTLTIRARHREAPWVVLELVDTGVGMSEEMQRRVAERDLALEADLAGRGLAAVLDIVERHRGSVTVESVPGLGTTVRLRLPASRFQIIPPSAPAAAPRPAEAAARVLLVDDDQRLLEVLSQMLRDGGYSVTTATSGDEALTAFDPATHDVVITDLGMPHITGWEVAERVKQRSPGTRVFLLTGWGERLAAHPSSRFVDRVIAKPISADALLETLASLQRPRG